MSKILANELLEEYLKKELDVLTNNGSNSFNLLATPKIKLQWTESKTSLVELIYALHSTNALNNGNADIKEIAAICEVILNIELGDYYGCFKQIKMRKTGQTKFLDTLTEVLQKRIDESEAD